MGRIFVSHSAKDPAERRVLDALVMALEDAGLQVLVDYKRLEPGMVWRSEIHTWMALCHAAVVLFSPNALLSQWVVNEALVLRWRLALDPDFRLIPVIVPPATRKEVTDDPRLTPAAFGELEFVGDATIAKVVKQLADLKATDPPTPMEAWVTRLSLPLRKVEVLNARILDQAAAAAGTDLPWVPNLTTSDLLARRLLHASREEIGSAVRLLGEVLVNDGTLTDIVDQVRTTWVDPLNVAAMPEIAKRSDPPRVIVLRASDTRVGMDYVSRAGCGTKFWRAVQTTNTLPEVDDDDVSLIVSDILTDARPYVGIGPDDEDTPVLEWIAAFVAKGVRFFAVIPSPRGLSARQIEALEAALPGFIFVLMAGPDVDSTAIEQSDPVILEPRLTPDDIKAIDTWIRLMRLSAMPWS